MLKPMMMSLVLSFVLFIAMLSGSLVAHAQVETIYGICQDTGQLISIDPATGAGSLIGNTGYNNCEGLELEASGSLLAVVNGRRLVRINPANADITDLGLIANISWAESISFNSDLSVLYASAQSSGSFWADKLVTIDISGPSATIIGAFSSVGDMDGLACSPDGELCGTNLAPERFVHIDPLTGDATVISSLNTYITGLDYASDGTLYGVTHSNSNLVVFNPSDGTYTTIGPTGFPKVSGLAIVPSEPVEGTISASLACVPESGTLPFPTSFELSLINHYGGQARRFQYIIDVTLGNGQFYSSWRRGWQNLQAGQIHNKQWMQTIPAWSSLQGENRFDMTAIDVTPAPYNLPPYPASGDTDTASCTVLGLAP